MACLLCAGPGQALTLSHRAVPGPRQAAGAAVRLEPCGVGSSREEQGAPPPCGRGLGCGPWAGGLGLGFKPSQQHPWVL